jgi:hypothetical protein
MLKFREENLQKNEEFDLIEEQRRKFQLKSKTLTSNICLQKKTNELGLVESYGRNFYNEIRMFNSENFQFKKNYPQAQIKSLLFKLKPTLPSLISNKLSPPQTQTNPLLFKLKPKTHQIGHCQ